MYSGNFKIFKNTIGQFIPNRPPKHVITSTNYGLYLVLLYCILYCISLITHLLADVLPHEVNYFPNNDFNGYLYKGQYCLS